MNLNIKNLRVESGKTQKALAESLHIARSTYNNYEQNVAEPNIETLIKLADYFDVSLDYLCGRQNSNLLFIDSLSKNKRQLIEMVKSLSEDETLIAIGFLAKLSNKPVDEVLKKVTETNNDAG